MVTAGVSSNPEEEGRKRGGGGEEEGRSDAVAAQRNADSSFCVMQ